MTLAGVARQLSNLISSQNILEKLKIELISLREQTQKVQENLTWDSEEYQTQNRWLKIVDETVARVDAFLNHYEGKSTCTNFLWRYKVDKQSRKMIVDISQLQKEGQSHLSVKPAKDYTGPKSRPDTIHDIMEALKNPQIQTIGVWALGGVGTTSIAKQVGEQAKMEQDLFNTVIVVTVTEKPKVEEVQGVIAAEFGLQFHEETHVKRRNRLRQRIKKEKVLVIVDDMWGELIPQEFDLEEFGVPLGDEHAGCKLLLTSGNLNFIQNLKGSPKPKVFQIEVLEEEEAQSLFKKMVDGVPQDLDEASSKAIEILRSCAGSASSFFAIAKALSNKGLDAWQDASMKLKENVSPLKLWFNILEKEELKSMLLLLTIRGRRAINRYNIYIDMWTGLFRNLDTSEAAKNKCDSLISDLKAYGLLVEDENKSVKVADFIWHTAYSIAQNDLKASMIFGKWPPEDWLEDLRFCNINILSDSQVPEKLQCQNLQQLVLSTDSSSIQVPDSFFEETKLLKVLHFVGFDCSKLPTSFGCLKNLEALSMHKCKLEDITHVGELTNLRVLSLLKSSIQQLPAQIGQLQKLLFLDLKDTHLQVIPSNVLSNLTSLEELYLTNSFCNWEAEISTKENKNASLEELTKLDHLAYIEDLHVPDPQAWPVDLFFGKLKSYTIFIGDRWDKKHDGDHGLKTLKLKLNRKFQSEDGIKKMFKSVEVLYLDELNGVQNVLNDLDCDSFPHLQSLFIQNNAEIKCIATRPSHDPLDVFPNLESLSLNNLSNLEHICPTPPLTEKSFIKLRIIKVQKCDTIEYLFRNSMINCLSHLANMEVLECKSIKAIVLVEGEENQLVEFTALCSLTLQGLPALNSFCSSEGTPSSTDTPTLFHDKVFKYFRHLIIRH